MRTRILLLAAVSVGIGPLVAAEAIGQEAAAEADLTALIGDALWDVEMVEN